MGWARRRGLGSQEVRHLRGVAAVDFGAVAVLGFDGGEAHCGGGVEPSLETGSHTGQIGRRKLCCENMPGLYLKGRRGHGSRNSSLNYRSYPSQAIFMEYLTYLLVSTHYGLFAKKERLIVFVEAIIVRGPSGGKCSHTLLGKIIHIELTHPISFAGNA